MSGGLFLEGTLKADATESAGPATAAGFVISEAADSSTAILLGVGSPAQREPCIGSLNGTDDGTFSFVVNEVTVKSCATVNGVENGKVHGFRLLVFRGAFELYIDDLLMQTHRCQRGGNKAGFIAENAEVTLGNLKVYNLSLSEG